MEGAVLAVERRTSEVHCHDGYHFSGLMKRLRMGPLRATPIASWHEAGRGAPPLITKSPNGSSQGTNRPPRGT